MTLGRRAWFVALVAMAAAGCATAPRTPERIPYNAEARRDIVRIAIVEPAPPAALLVDARHFESFVGGLALFGGFGVILAVAGMVPAALVASVDEAIKTKVLADAAVDAGFDPSGTLVESLTVELERIGLRATRHSVPRATATTSTDSRWLADYRPWRDSADAVLDIQWLVIGFRSSSSLGTLMPVASVVVRLVDPRDHRVLFRDTLSLGVGMDYSGRLDANGGNIPTGLLAKSHGFPTFLELNARPDEAFDGLRSAIRLVAARLAVELAPP